MQRGPRVGTNPPGTSVSLHVLRPVTTTSGRVAAPRARAVLAAARVARASFGAVGAVAGAVGLRLDGDGWDLSAHRMLLARCPPWTARGCCPPASLPIGWATRCQRVM